MGDEKFPATVIKVIDDYQIVINKGSQDGVKVGQRFLIYEETDELLQDPITLEGLGNLEIPKGTGKTIYVKEKWATIESDKTTVPTKRIIKKTRTNTPSALAAGMASSSMGLFGASEIEVEETVETPGNRISFDSPLKGDKVKPI